MYHIFNFIEDNCSLPTYLHDWQNLSQHNLHHHSRCLGEYDYLQQVRLEEDKPVKVKTKE
jgi:hypothetical protein